MFSLSLDAGRHLHKICSHLIAPHCSGIKNLIYECFERLVCHENLFLLQSLEMCKGSRKKGGLNGCATKVM